MLANIRNLYAFHFHNGRDLSPFLEHLPDDAPLSVYYGLCDANTVNHFALEPFITSLMHTTRAANGDEAIVRIVRELQVATMAFHRLVRGVGEILFTKMGSLQVHEHQIDQRDVGVIDQQRFPTVIKP